MRSLATMADEIAEAAVFHIVSLLEQGEDPLKHGRLTKVIHERLQEIDLDPEEPAYNFSDEGDAFGRKWWPADVRSYDFSDPDFVTLRMIDGTKICLRYSLLRIAMEKAQQDLESRIQRIRGDTDDSKDEGPTYPDCPF